ncbi:MAG: DUF4115 domain-containing protein [Deltaproteobacteria bacterium]|nr:DUF4115 domain-containing protein [Deltaproteobacteria bacterium]
MRVAMVPREVGERSHIAETLRTTRERLELTIERAAADAGVPLRYARLLEGEVPSRVGVSDELYLIPFFRRYATALGLPAEELLPDFLGHVQELPPPSAAPVHLRARSRAATFWRPVAVLLAIAGATFVILRQTPERPSVEDEHWSEAERVARADGVDRTAADEPTPNAPPSVASKPVAANPAVAPEATPAGVAPPPAPAVGARELRIVAAEETWLSLGVDDQPKRDIILQPGETRSWSAARAFTLTVGNAGGITLSLDGRELPPLGRSGQVVRNLRLPDGATSPG